MKRLGGVSDPGMEKRKVVEVPRERTASPGLERDITVAGLSPVKGATMHSEVCIVSDTVPQISEGTYQDSKSIV